MTITHNDILNDPIIKKRYDACDSEEHEKYHHAYHGWRHVLNTIDIANKLFEVIPIDNETKNAVLIGLALHDIGKEYINGKKQESHDRKGYVFAKKYLEGKTVPQKDEVLCAILWHDKDFYKNNMIAELVSFCDKMDVTIKRATELGKTIDYLMFPHILETKFRLTEKIFGVTFITDKHFDRLLHEADWFIPKVYTSIENMARTLGRTHEIGFKKAE